MRYKIFKFSEEKSKRYGYHWYDYVLNKESSYRDQENGHYFLKEIADKIKNNNKIMKDENMNRENTIIKDYWSYYIIIYNGKLNYLNKDYKLISRKWFLKVTYFNWLYAWVQREDQKRNFLKEDWKILCKSRFDKVWTANNKLAAYLNGEKFYIDNDWNKIKVIKHIK